MNTVKPWDPVEPPLVASALAAALAAAPDGVIAIDGDGIIRMWNAAAEAIFGHSAAAAIGAPLAALVMPARFRSAHGERLHAFVPGSGSMHLNRRVRFPGLRADGVEIDLELAITPVPGPDGVWFVAFVRDVTQRLSWDHELISRESELRDMGERLRTLVASLPFGVIVEDRDRRLLIVNDAMFTIFEIGRDEAREIAGRPMNVGERFAEIFADPSGFLARREAVLAAQELVLDERIMTVDGRVYTRDYIPIRVDGEYQGHLWLWRDVSRLVEAEESRERALADERMLRLATEEQVRVLEDLSRLRNEFVGTISHELRTPLTTVLGFAELMGDEDLTPVQREYLDVIERSANRMLRLVGDMLLLARLVARTVELELVEQDLARLCRDAVAENRSAIEAAGLALGAEIADGPPVRGDAVRLRQVVDNLLANARQFTPAGGRIDVRLAVDGEAWLLEVADTGVGIPAEEQARLFTQFYRGSNAPPDTKAGSGLGLVIAHAIVEAHHGQISLTSAEGVGTTVRVRQPVAPPQPAPTGTDR